MAAKRLLTAFLAASLLALTVTCGRSHNQSSVESQASRVQQPTAGASRGSGFDARHWTHDARLSLDSILREIDAYPTPKGVSAETWTTLKAELKRLLIARGKDGKTLSIAPVGTLCRVTDLAAASNTAGTQGTLTWTEALAGDCDNDGQVYITDLQPIAAHYGETSTGPGSPAYLADADGDGQVFITDLQPVAADYGMHLQGYQVWRGHWNGTSTDWETTPRPNPNAANPDWTADRPSPPPVSTRPAYTFLDDISGLADKANVRYKVTAFGDGAPGADSNEAVMPPPAYFAVTGTVLESGVGLAGVTLTLTPGGLNATTAADGTYTIAGVQDGTYTLAPNKVAYLFTPTVLQVTVSGAGSDGNDFSATNHPPAVSAWPKFHADARNTGQSPYVGAQTNSVRWTYTIGVTNGSPSIGPDGTVYISGSGGYLYAVNPSDGSLKWKAQTGGGPSTPAIGVDGTIFVGTNDGGKFFALSPIDGSVKWQRIAGSSIQSSPTIGADGTIYVGSNETLTSTYTFFALNQADGTIKWKADAGQTVISSPAIGPDGTVFVGSVDHNVYAFDPSDASVKWTYLTGAGVSSSPAVGTDGTVFVGGGDGIVYALYGADGSQKWKYTTGVDIYAGVDGSASLSTDGIVLIQGFDYPNSTLYALDGFDGVLKWSFSTGGDTGSSSAIGADGTIYIGGGNSVYALNSSDGSVKWQYVSHATVDSSPAIGEDGTVYIVCSLDGTVEALYAFGP